MIGRDSQVYKSTKENVKPLLQGVVLSVDPSIGSKSSQPGWAVYRQGEFVTKGTIPIHPDLPVWKRLRMLANGIRRLYQEFNPDVLVYEEIPSQRYGGGNANAHASLLKAVGVILSVPGPDGYVGIFPSSWKKLARDTYEKSDENDAEEMGWIVLNLARSMRK